MTKEQIVARLKELLEPQKIDPYWYDNPGFFDYMIRSLIEDIEQSK